MNGLKKTLFYFYLICTSFCLYSQKDAAFKLDSVPRTEGAQRVYGIQFPLKWKYQKGDDLAWAKTEFNDSLWNYVATKLDFDSLKPNTFDGIGWFRLHIQIDSSLINQSLGLMIEQMGASEIYLDGKMIHELGQISIDDVSKQQRFSPKGVPLNLEFKGGVEHVLAVRYAHAKAVENFNEDVLNYCGFGMRIGLLKDATFFMHIGGGIIISIFMFYFTFFVALAFVHLMLFLYFKENKSNLYYSIFNFSFGSIFLINVIQMNFSDVDFATSVSNLRVYLPNIYIPALLAMLYSIFYNNKLPKIFWLWVFIFGVDIILTFFKVNIPYLEILFNAIAIIEPLRIIIVALVKKKDGAKIVGIGIISTIVFFILFFTLPFFTKGGFLNVGHGLGLLIMFITIYFTLNIPLSMTLVLARNFANTNKILKLKLEEVEELSVKSIEQEKEKQKILENQNEVLETQVNERTKEISEQKKLIEEKNKDITDSINYAKRLQDAILPPLNYISQYIPENFVLYKPKDIVAGDFYWMEVVNESTLLGNTQLRVGSQQMAEGSKQFELNEKVETAPIILIASADCTGHGVPGAMVSVVCSNALNRAVNEFGITEPGKILDKVRELVVETFQKSESEVKDGMDVSLLSIKLLSQNSKGVFEIKWAGANNPLWYFENGVHKEITAHKQSIGKTDSPTAFPTHALTLNAGDTIFLFTDGYADQFGGPKGKKFKYKQLADLLSSSEKMPMNNICDLLDKSIESWKNGLEQIDDICIIGIRLL